MEQEEREAQSAKLQELIRRGTPHDLQEANRLMKVMAGFDTRNKTDYRAKAAEEVSKIQQKAKLLEDMLQKHQAGDQIKEGDVFEVRPGRPLSWEAVVKADRMQELANALASAHPKIQKMCEEESDDHEAVAKLLEINDSIHRTLERYKLIKKGDVEGAAKIPKGTLGVSGAGVRKGPDNELSLIDFGGPEEPAAAPAGQASASSSAPAPKGNALEDDLLGLNLGGDSFGQGGGISLGATNGAGTDASNWVSIDMLTLLISPAPATDITEPPWDSFLAIAINVTSAELQCLRRAWCIFNALTANSASASPYVFSPAPAAPTATAEAGRSLCRTCIPSDRLSVSIPAIRQIGSVSIKCSLRSWRHFDPAPGSRASSCTCTCS